MPILQKVAKKLEKMPEGYSYDIMKFLSLLHSQLLSNNYYSVANQ